VDVSSNLGDYYAQFNLPIDVTAIDKLTKWPNLQSVGHDAQLKDLTSNFHGVVDAKVQFLKHTMANPRVLIASWQAIMPMILGNQEVAKLMTIAPVLGNVGKKVLDFPNMGAVFSSSAGELTVGVQAVGQKLGV
jgi:hypothetical protein